MKAALIHWPRFRVFLAGIVLAGVASPAQAQASDAVVDELFTVIEAERNALAVRRAAANYMDTIVHDALAQLNQSAANNRRLKLQIDEQTRGLLGEISWDKIKPLYISVYKGEFTDEELKSIIAYYKSPAGRKFRERQDVLNQEKSRITKELLATLRPKLKQIVDRMTAEALAGSDKDSPTLSSSPAKSRPSEGESR